MGFCGWVGGWVGVTSKPQIQLSPQTLNPKLQTLNPKPLTLNPKSESLNPLVSRLRELKVQCLGLSFLGNLVPLIRNSRTDPET